MLDLLTKAPFINFYPGFLITTNIIIFITGFIYGYSSSFLFYLKKVLAIGFFVIILSSLTVMSFAGIFITTGQCIASEGLNLCSGIFGALGPAASSLILLLLNLFINLIMGMISVLFGIMFFYPSYWIIKRYTKLPSLKESVTENEYLNSTSRNITFGDRNLANKIHTDKNNTDSL